MTRARIAAAALILLAAVAAAALVLAALLTPRPWTVQVGAPGDAYVLSNTYAPEGGEAALRWTRAATGLHLHGAYAGRGLLELRLYRDPEGTAGRPWPIELRSAQGVPLTSFEATPGWRRYQIALPAGAASGPLTLISPTFSPGDRDARILGVALAELRLKPLAGSPPLAYALARAGWFFALLAAIGAAAWAFDAYALGAAAERGRARRVFALIAGLGAAAATWAWLEPRSFAWALPTVWAWPAALLALSVALAVGRSLLPRAARSAFSADSPRTVVWFALAALAASHLLLLLPLPLFWRQAGALLVLLAPGALAALALLWNEGDGAERAFLAVAGGLGVAALLTLALHALPGPLPAWALLIAANGLSVLGLLALWRRQGTLQGAASTQGRPHRWLLLALLLAALLRLWGLGVNQFQGDEAYALLLARGVAHGQDEVLLVHLKGPIEALLPAGPLVLTGTIGEAGARLPFALAGMALVLAAWSLAGRLIGGRAGDLAGFVAALAVSADGLLVAFGRLVQYQTIVLLMSAAALWLCWRFYAGAAARHTLPAAALCAAVAVLAHYDGIYVAPAFAWLVLAGGLRRRWDLRGWLGGVGPALAVGLVLTLSFYLPFVCYEHFASTISHLETRSGQGAAPGLALYNNLPGYSVMLSTYATRYVAAFAALALLVALATLLVSYLRPRPLALALAVLLVAGSLIALLAPQLVASGPGTSYAGLVVIPPLLALLLAPRLPAGLRAIALWLVAALSAQAFLISDPRTHFYTAHLAGWLVVGWLLARLWELTPSPGLARTLRPTLAAAGAAVLALGLTYTGMVFLRTQPEYERAFPASRLAFFAPPGGELPDDGLFAFPAQDGWKAAAVLFAEGELRGSADSNAEKFTPGWYLRGQFRCQVEPDYFLTATAATPLFIPPRYSLAAVVTVDGVETLQIYSREPVAGPPRRLDAADYAPRFDALPVPDFPLRRLLTGVVPQVRLETPWQAGFALRGFDLDRSALGPGESAFLTLYWRSAIALPNTYTPVVTIRDAVGRVVAEAPPYCGGAPSDTWVQLYPNDTAFRIAASSLPPGEYTLHAAVRDRTSGALVPLAAGGEWVELGRLRVGGS